jgi:hypothetical protein
MTQKEMDDDTLAKKLRRDGKITTSGKPFKESQRIEIEALIGNGVFRIKPYDPIKYGKFRIFKSRIVNEIKGKATNFPYEKSRIMIQSYSDDGKKNCVNTISYDPTNQLKGGSRNGSDAAKAGHAPMVA